ncbi:MAG: 2-succinyl-6-hydroxy-2,4-cyclohexadiene-1-carboxylate synthase, partial [Myxococcota bacterium]
MSAAFRHRIETVGGIELCVHERGSGPPLLLLHGFTGSARSLDELAGGLARTHRVIVPDLVGHGGSDAPFELDPYRMARCVEQLCALLDALETGPVGVLGYSMGGRVALALLVQAPERIHSALLISAGAGIAEPEARAERVCSDEALARRIEEQGVAAFVDVWLSQPLFASQMRRLDARALKQTRDERLANSAHGLANSLRGMGSGAQPPVHEALSTIACPVALVVGEEDEKFRHIAQDLAQRLPQGHVHCVPRAGHAVHLENPGALLTVALDHFTSTGTAPRDAMQRNSPRAQSEHSPSTRGRES